METSMMMVIKPDVLLPLSEAGAGAARRFRVAGLREGWVWAPRKWSSVTKDTGTGNPRASTREKGEHFIDAVTKKIAGFLAELAAADINDLYE
jgi:creatinine amidohydrolase